MTSSCPAISKRDSRAHLAQQNQYSQFGGARRRLILGLQPNIQTEPKVGFLMGIPIPSGVKSEYGGRSAAANCVVSYDSLFLRPASLPSYAPFCQRMFASTLPFMPLSKNPKQPGRIFTEFHALLCLISCELL